MSSWSRRESWHVRLDASLRTYVGQVVHLLSGRPDADVLDVAAGSAWLGQLPFRSYTPLDILPPHERWDLDTPLPDHHVGRYDVVVCLGALHYTRDPWSSLRQLCRALRSDGELLVGVPWLYPPHDRVHDRWRMAPRQVWTMVREEFPRVDLHPNGSLFHLPMHVLNYYVTGPFRGIDASDFERLRQRPIPEPWRAETIDDVPTSWFGPMGVIAHGYGRGGPA